MKEVKIQLKLSDDDYEKIKQQLVVQGTVQNLTIEITEALLAHQPLCLERLTGKLA